jgi:hypothetical protein
MPKTTMACLVAGFALTLVGGCHDSAPAMPGGGRPLGPAEVDHADGGPADAYESPRRDGALDDDGGPPVDGGGGGGPDAAATGPDGGGGLDEAACNACDETSCRDVDDLDLYAACFLVSDPASAGGAAGTPKSTLCQAILHCARVTGCAASDPQPCYCGAGVTDLQCLAGNANGPCKHEVELAAESSSSGTIAERLSDPSFASGAAFNLLRYCETPTCGAACSGGAGPLPDASVPPPTPDAALPPPTPDAALPPPTHVCADLDGDSHPDCDETLLANAAFHDDATSWSGEFGAAAEWDRVRDGTASATSGSIIVTNTIVVDAPGVTMTGASQCVPAVAAAAYRLAAHVFVPAGQGAGSAAANVQFFAAPGCSGGVTGAYSSDPAPGAAGAWNVLTGSFAVPSGAASMRVRLVVVKDFGAPAWTARFDDVLLERP